MVSMLIAALGGLTVGAALGGGMLALGVITRIMAICGAKRARAGWAFAVGAGGAAFLYMAGLSVPLGAWAGWSILLVGGAFVGMTAAALAELMEIMPVMLINARVKGLVRPTVIALMLGKALGALLAAAAGI